MNKTMAKQIRIGEQSRGVNKYENHHFFFILFLFPIVIDLVYSRSLTVITLVRSATCCNDLNKARVGSATVSMWHWSRAASTKRSLKMRPINMTALNNDITGTQRFCASLEPPIIAGITTRRLTRAT
jgi:hypothetical protein